MTATLTAGSPYPDYTLTAPTGLAEALNLAEQFQLRDALLGALSTFTSSLNAQEAT